MVGIFHGTDFLTFEIINRFHFFIGRHHTKSLVRISQQFITCFFISRFHQIQKFRIIDGLTHLCQCLESTGGIENCRFRDEVDLWGCILYHKRDISVITALQEFSVPAQYAVRINLDLHLSIAQSSHFFCKFFCIDLSYGIFRACSCQWPGIALFVLRNLFTATTVVAAISCRIFCGCTACHRQKHSCC